MTAFVLRPGSFEASILAARRRRVVLPAEFYGRLQGQARAAAFTVSKLSQVEQIAAVRRSLERDLAGGGDFEAWRERMLADPRFAHLSPAHLETVYRTNLQAHHATGRAASILANEKARPYLMYSAILDTRVRPEHAALHGTILPVGHPFWRTHFPPLGFNCRCQVIALSKRQAEARIAAAKARGKVVDVAPEGEFFDDGWGYDRLNGAPTAGPARAVRRRAVKAADAPTVSLADAEAARAAALARAIDEQSRWVLDQARPFASVGIEFASVVGPDGALRLRKRGQRHQVSFTDAESALVRGATLIHNHPSGAALSVPDFRYAAHVGAAEIIAVGQRGEVYRGAALLGLDALSYGLREVSKRVEAVVWSMIRGGTAARSEADYWHSHIVCAVAAARGMVRYEARGLPAMPSWVNQAISRCQ